MGRRPSLRRFNLLFLLLLAFSFSALAKAEEGNDVRFQLFNDDFELSFEVGPAFFPNPVFESAGTFYPKTKIKHDQPRYIGVSLGWWANPYLLLQTSINFTSVDFVGSANMIDAIGFNNVSKDFFLYRTNLDQSLSNNLLTAPTVLMASEGCGDIVSVFCAMREPIKTEITNNFITGSRAEYRLTNVTAFSSSGRISSARTLISTDEVENRTLIANMTENKFLMTLTGFNTISAEVGGRSDITWCLQDCQLSNSLDIFRAQRLINPITQVETVSYDDSIRGHLTPTVYDGLVTRITTLVESSGERCYSDCIERRVRSAVNLLVPPHLITEYIQTRTEAGNIVVMGGVFMGTTYMRRPEYTTALASDDCKDLETDAAQTCALAAARTQISTNHREGLTQAYDGYIETQAQYTAALAGDACRDLEADAAQTCALAEAKADIFNDFLEGRPEYTTARNSDSCRDLETEARNACALNATDDLIREDEAGALALREGADGDSTAINAAIKGALDAQNIVPEVTASAAGTFLSVGGFFNVYANYPITRTLSIYGGGGVGLAWTKIKDGLITRTANVTLTTSQELAISQHADIAALTSSTTLASSIQSALTNISRTQTTTRDISDPTLSVATSASVGFRAEAFEGLIVDTGYQMQWNPNLYKGASGQLIHQVRLGFVFRF